MLADFLQEVISNYGNYITTINDNHSDYQNCVRIGEVGANVRIRRFESCVLRKVEGGPSAGPSLSRVRQRPTPTYCMSEKSNPF